MNRSSTRLRPVRLADFLAVLGSALAIFAFGFGSVATAEEGPIDLALYAQLLEQHTRVTPDTAGVRVDYEAIRSDPGWKRLVTQVQDARPSQLDRAGQMAFWINAYNILAIDLVAKHFPIESIKDIGTFFSPVWGHELATIEGVPISLGEIEHERLRPTGDPRIHAAIVCASTSCPPLARTPYRPDHLEEDLSVAMRTWLSSPKKGFRIDRASRRVFVSKIFDWFEDDFERTGGALATAARYTAPGDAAWLRANMDRVSIEYLDYDWSLNGLRR
jgi:hypothetical protein